MFHMKGGSDLCVKLGLNTPGEEVGHSKVHNWSMIWIMCDREGRLYLCVHVRVQLHASVQFICVFLYVHESSYLKCNRRMSEFKRSILTPHQKAEHTHYTLELPLSTSMYLCLSTSVKRRGLEGWRKHTKLQSACLSLFL